MGVTDGVRRLIEAGDDGWEGAVGAIGGVGTVWLDAGRTEPLLSVQLLRMSAIAPIMPQRRWSLKGCFINPD